MIEALVSSPQAVIENQHHFFRKSLLVTYFCSYASNIDDPLIGIRLADNLRVEVGNLSCIFLGKSREK